MMFYGIGKLMYILFGVPISRYVIKIDKKFFIVLRINFIKILFDQFMSIHSIHIAHFIKVQLPIT